MGREFSLVERVVEKVDRVIDGFGEVCFGKVGVSKQAVCEICRRKVCAAETPLPEIDFMRSALFDADAIEFQAEERGVAEHAFSENELRCRGDS